MTNTLVNEDFSIANNKYSSKTKKETLAKLLSGEFENFNNSFFLELLWMAAPDYQ